MRGSPPYDLRSSTSERWACCVIVPDRKSVRYRSTRVDDGALREKLRELAGQWRRFEIAAWVEDCNRERPHSSLGYTTPAAFAAELAKQWPLSRSP